jgi:peptidoglycan hydrolase CwlO-like protein
VEIQAVVEQLETGNMDKIKELQKELEELQDQYSYLESDFDDLERDLDSKRWQFDKLYSKIYQLEIELKFFHATEKKEEFVNDSYIPNENQLKLF